MSLNEISLLFVFAAGSGIVAKYFKQPLLIGYLFSGAALAYFGIIKDKEALLSIGQIGVALLLFLVGLEINIGEFKSVGKIALLTGLGQIIFTSSLGFVLSRILGFDTLASIYIAVALTFSSTIIIVKLLSEKNDLDSLYGKISIGFLLVQDVVAILILMFLSGLKDGGIGISDYVFIVIKGGLLLSSIWYLSKKILPYLFEKYIAVSGELLSIVSIAWALGVASFVAGPMGFSFEMGGFLAGIALANLPEHLQIASKTRPLRDFFLTIFFLSLGTKLIVGGIGTIIFPAIIFSLFVLIGNPLVVLVVMGVLGHRKRTSFLASVTVAQISEFSFVLMAMGQSVGHVGQDEVATVVMVGVVTMTISTYLILEAERIFKVIGGYLSVFEKTNSSEPVSSHAEKIRNHVVLVGCDKSGRRILKMLIKLKSPLLVVDFNPQVLTRLTADRVPVLFGDISDTEVAEYANLGEARLVISTTSNLADNLALLEHVKSFENPPLSIFTTKLRFEAIQLYEAGADYVVIPDIITGEHISHVLNMHGIESKYIKNMGKLNFRRILEK